MRLQSEELAGIRNDDSVSASFAERIRIAGAADIEASRSYHQQVNAPDCFVDHWRKSLTEKPATGPKGS